LSPISAAYDGYRHLIYIANQGSAGECCPANGVLLLSNSDTPFIRTLYSGFNIKVVDVERNINCKGSKRTGHKELPADFL
jgi:site-specific DNA-adenine methylase